METTAQKPKLEILPGVFLATTWLRNRNMTTGFPLYQFLGEGENKEKARKLIRQYLEEGPGEWDILGITKAQVIKRGS